MQSAKNKIDNFQSSVFTGNKQKCSGCGACVQICMHDAIQMQEDEEGFLFPKIDESKCVQCGLCDRTCPEVNTRYENRLDDQHFYLATNKTPISYKDCATIGLCSMLAEKMLANGGFVFGVRLCEDNWKAFHTCVENSCDLAFIKNSKYIQSDTGNSFKEAKRLLKKGNKVLYIGTPCEISGLKSYLRKEYEQLYTIDIFCHGTFSYKILQKEIEYWTEMFDGKIHNYKFRSRLKYAWNYGGVVNFDVLYSNGKIKHIERHGSASPAYRLYAYSPDGISYVLRETCYKCKFRDEGRYGDISIGDAWKIKGDYLDVFTEENRKNGISAFSCNTKKGQELLTLCLDKLNVKKISRGDFFGQAALLPTNRDIPNKRYEIYKHLDTQDWNEYIQQFFAVNLEDVQRSFERKVNIDNIKKIIKKIIKWKK